MSHMSTVFYSFALMYVSVSVLSVICRFLYLPLQTKFRIGICMLFCIFHIACLNVSPLSLKSD